MIAAVSQKLVHDYQEWNLRETSTSSYGICFVYRELEIMYGFADHVGLSYVRFSYILYVRLQWGGYFVYAVLGVHEKLHSQGIKYCYPGTLRFTLHP